ncbi:MAG: hydroxyphenylacetyl-CoA thioesterase PaaI [Nocardioidaceae bacterium]|nr:hydroxyphenylacetyl-CoA thioesterase PaaI [Nocardioidaceae bacterium]
MLGQDAASTMLGITLVDVGPGRAVTAMTVRADMVNGWGSCHGALVAAVADTAFAVACNSFGVVTVAQNFEIEFLLAAKEGDRLVATATRRSGAGRTGVYDVTVTREGSDEVVAEFRGRSRSLGTPIEPGAQA